MKTSIYAMIAELYIPSLQSLSGLLDKGAAYAQATNLDLNVLVESKLAPDMFPLNRQVQQVCFHAVDAVAHLTGGEPAKRTSDASSFDDMKTLLAHTIAGLSALNAAAFEGTEDRKIEIPLMGPMVFESDGFQFLCHWSLPNFYFHLVTAYDILRHLGVEIGKRDFMPHAMAFVVQRG